MPISRSVRITRTAISPRLATRTVSNIYATVPTALVVPKARPQAAAFGTESANSHAEDAITDLLQWGVRTGGQGEAQHGAGLRGVDDAVVPEPGGGVVGVPLRLVLLADRLLERLLVLGGPLLAAGLDAVAPDG